MTGPPPSTNETSGASFHRTAAGPGGIARIKSEDLLREHREVEIEHQGRIYRLRVTNLNKLILTA